MRCRKGKQEMPKKDDNTSIGGSDRYFPETEWTKILGPTLSQAVLAELCQKYWKPVYMYLRRRGYDNETAKDLVQGFFTDKVLGQEFVKKADKTRGKFRTFLLTAVSNYANDIYRTIRFTQKLNNVPKTYGQNDNPDTDFNRAWAETLLLDILKELESECHRRGKAKHWNLFKAWFLEADSDDQKINMSKLCSRYGIKDRDAAYNMIANIKGRFRAILRRSLRSLVDSDTEVDDEIMNFIDTFSMDMTR
jgi:hypothetical protein